MSRNPKKKSSTKKPTTTKRAKLREKDTVEEVYLGKLPVVDRQPDGTYKGRLADQYEWRATGRATQELKGLTERSVERLREKEAQLESKFGLHRITDKFGNVHVRRGDEAALLEKDEAAGWCRKATRPTFMVPELPWQAEHRRRDGVRERIIYRDGQRIVETITK